MTGDRQEEVSRSEPRLDFIQDFTLKSMRCKQDKWQRMIVSDDVRRFVLDFIEWIRHDKISYINVLIGLFIDIL